MPTKEQFLKDVNNDPNIGIIIDIADIPQDPEDDAWSYNSITKESIKEEEDSVLVLEYRPADEEDEFNEGDVYCVFLLTHWGVISNDTYYEEFETEEEARTDFERLKTKLLSGDYSEIHVRDDRG